MTEPGVIGSQLVITFGYMVLFWSQTYQPGNTSSRMITEVKQCWARLVLEWETIQMLLLTLKVGWIWLAVLGCWFRADAELVIGQYRLGVQGTLGTTCGRCHNWVGIPGRPPYVTPRGSAGWKNRYICAILSHISIWFGVHLCNLQWVTLPSMHRPDEKGEKYPVWYFCLVFKNLPWLKFAVKKTFPFSKKDFLVKRSDFA